RGGLAGAISPRGRADASLSTPDDKRRDRQVIRHGSESETYTDPRWVFLPLSRRRPRGSVGIARPERIFRCGHSMIPTTFFIYLTSADALRSTRGIGSLARTGR